MEDKKKINIPAVVLKRHIKSPSVNVTFRSFSEPEQNAEVRPEQLRRQSQAATEETGRIGSRRTGSDQSVSEIWLLPPPPRPPSMIPVPPQTVESPCLGGAVDSRAYNPPHN